MKSRSIVIALILALLCAGVANAALEISASPTLGGENQERGQTACADFEIKDTELVGTKTVTVRIESNSGYTLNTTSSTYTLNNAVATAVRVCGYVPLNMDAVDGNLNEIAHQTGTLYVNDTTATDYAPVNMQAANHLSIDKIKVIVGGKSKTVDDGDEIEDIQVGDDLSIEIAAENTGDDDDRDNDMSDVEISALVDDSDFDVDEEEEIDIDAGDTETVTFDGLSVSDDVEDDTYELEIKVDGRDDNGARHGEAASIDLTVERNSHDIAVRSVSLTRSTVSCDSPTTEASVYLVNIGTHDEENVAVRVENAALGINTYVSGMSLDESDSMSKTLSLSPKTDKPGTYTLDVIGYWNGNVESSRKQVTLTVAACTPSGSTTGTTGGSTVVVTPTPVTPTPVVTPQPTTPQPVNVPVGKVTSASSSSKTDWTIPLLIVGIVIVLVLLGLLIAVLVRGRGSA